MVRTFCLLSVLFFFAGCGPKPTPETASTKPEESQVESSELSRNGSLILPRGKKSVAPTKPTKALVTKSKFEADFSNVEYPNVALNSNQLDEAWVQACMRGATHFQKINKLDTDQSASFLELFEHIIRLDLCGARPDTWLEIQQQLLDLANDDTLQEDPFYNLMRIVILVELEEHLAVEKQIFGLVQTFRKYDYPAFFVVWAQVKLFESGRLASPRPNQNAANLEIHQALLYWLAEDFRLEPKDHRVAWKLISEFVESQDTTNVSRIERAFKPIINEPKVAPWIRTMVHATYLTRKAWNIRGAGVVSSVDKKAWDEFIDHQKKSVGYFKKALDINPSAPEPAGALTKIAMTSMTEESKEFWFERTQEIQFDYMPVYEHMLFGLFPRWGGSTPELLEFGRQCYETRRFDTRVPFVLIDAFIYARAATNDRFDSDVDEVLNSKELYINMQDCMNQLVDQNESLSVSKDHDLSFQAYFNGIVTDYEASERALSRLGDYNHPDLFERMKITESPTFYRSHIHAMAGEFVNEAYKVQSIMFSQDHKLLPEAIKISDEIIANEPPEATSWHFRVFNEQAKHEFEFAAGNEVQFKFDKELSSWFPWHPRRLNYVDENTVEVNTNIGVDETTLSPQGFFPGPKSIEVEIEPLTTRFETPTRNAWGILVGNYLDIEYSVTFSATDNRIWFGRADVKPVLYYEVNRQTEFPVKLRVNVFDGYLEVFLNNTFIFRSHPSALTPCSRVTLVHPKNHGGLGGIVRLSNLKIKRLKMDPPPLHRDGKTLEEYFTKQISLDDTDPFPFQWRGLVLHGEKQYAECINDLQDAIDNGADISLPAFFIGDAWDRLGESAKALEWYQKAAESKGITERMPFPFDARKKQVTDDYFDHARFRLAWVQMGRPELFDKEVISTDGLSFAGRIAPEWAANRGEAQVLATQFDFDGAIELLTKDLSQIPAEYADDVQAQLAAYKKKEVYKVDPDSKFHFQYLTKPTAYFPFFDELMTDNWKKTYQ